MKGLHKHSVSAKPGSMAWMKEDARDLERQEEIRAESIIILHLVDYMEQHQMSQTDLARRLNVTPQYIHKLLHGQDSSFRIETAMEYGRKLGISLIEIPPVAPVYTEFHFSANGFLPWVAPTAGNSSAISVEINDVKSKKSQSWKLDKQLAIA